MPSYDGAYFEPPAPVAHVVLRDPESGMTVSAVLMLLDTGADITLLPRTAIRQFGNIPSSGQLYELRAFDGTTSSVPAVMLDMLFLSRAFRGRYLVIDGDWGILGRDILNHVAILLDGPQQQWSERP